MPTPAANAAIYYQHEAFTTDLAKLMGRNAAGAGFLRAFARHADVERYIGYARDRKEFDQFSAQVGAPAGAPAKAGSSRREAVWVPHGDLGGLAKAGALFVYSPGVGDFCWQRRFASDAAYSVIGLTHTISSDRVMEDFGQLLIAPVAPWDALICTSNAVRRTLEGVLESWGAYLGERLGAPAPASRLQLPVIPLGVDCDAFAARDGKSKLRADFRRRHAIGEQDVAFMFIGRLSFHAKAHPLPMYLALEAAAQRSGRKLTFILCGYYFNDSIHKQFAEGAKRFCPSVRVIQVDGRKPDLRDGCWAGADAFLSFSDNIQESFGLAPVEAMAAGLPAVVSDWDGYRDTVVHGETGFCIPTAMPGPGNGPEFALRYLAQIDTYDMYIGRTGQCTAVDIAAATDACVALIEDPALRRRLGEAGRRRAREVFDWPVIVRQYQALWGELGERRLAARKDGANGATIPGRGHPLRDDPFRLFRAFPTFAIGPDTLLEAAVASPAADLAAEAKRIAQADMNNFALAFMLRTEEFAQVFAALAGGRRLAVRDLQAQLAPARHGALLRGLGWLAKGGVIRLYNGG